MIVWELKLFGLFPILAVSRTAFEVEAEEDSARIEGGSAHNFERDFDPIKPEDRYNWEWEDKRREFGFGKS